MCIYLHAQIYILHKQRYMHIYISVNTHTHIYIQISIYTRIYIYAYTYRIYASPQKTSVVNFVNVIGGQVGFSQAPPTHLQSCTCGSSFFAP